MMEQQTMSSKSRRRWYAYVDQGIRDEWREITNNVISLCDASVYDVAIPLGYSETMFRQLRYGKTRELTKVQFLATVQFYEMMMENNPTIKERESDGYRTLKKKIHDLKVEFFTCYSPYW